MVNLKFAKIKDWNSSTLKHVDADTLESAVTNTCAMKPPFDIRILSMTEKEPAESS